MYFNFIILFGTNYYIYKLHVYILYSTAEKYFFSFKLPPLEVPDNYD